MNNKYLPGLAPATRHGKLNLLTLPLLVQLAPQLLALHALGLDGLLALPHGLLVPEGAWVPGLLEVQVSSAHFLIFNWERPPQIFRKDYHRFKFFKFFGKDHHRQISFLLTGKTTTDF